MYGPRWVDVERLGDVQQATLTSYRRGAAEFLQFLDSAGFCPGCAEECDDLLVEWSTCQHLRPSQFRMALAAVEFVYPRFRGKLQWSRQRLESLDRAAPPTHAQPCGGEVAALLGAELASQDHARYGLGLRFQATVGLRPGELIHLVPEDFRESPEHDKRWLVVIRLGRDVGTKVKREQFTLLDVREHAALWRCLKIALSLTPAEHPVFLFSLASYAFWLKRVQASLNLPLGISPHSPRVGYVSDALARGVPPQRIREGGRWLSEQSFRIYADVVGSLHAGQAARLAGYDEAIAWVTQHPEEYFNEVSLDVYRVRRHAGLAAGSSAGGAQATEERGGRGTGGRGRRGAGRGRGPASRGRG